MARLKGFTLLELLVVLVVLALFSAGVGVALRDQADEAATREGLRLVALLEAARAESRATGRPIVWQAATAGFHFSTGGTDAPPLPATLQERAWLHPDTQFSPNRLVLGPEPIIPPQVLTLRVAGYPVRLASDGLQPFAAQPLTGDAGTGG